MTADPGSQVLYSNISAHLVAAVLASALQRADGDHPRPVLDYARQKLFDPLGINTRPALTKPVPDDSPEFDRARFGWGTDPQGIPAGAFGLRLRTTDLLRIGAPRRRLGGKAGSAPPVGFKRPGRPVSSSRSTACCGGSTTGAGTTSSPPEDRKVTSSPSCQIRKPSSQFPQPTIPKTRWTKKRCSRC
jgi:CubicO group peptidase (beta-lactamase class C family)